MFDISLAFMALANTRLEAVRTGGEIEIRLKAPLNFDYGKAETATVELETAGKVSRVELREEGKNSVVFSARVKAPAGEAVISYGYGCFGPKAVAPGI